MARLLASALILLACLLAAGAQQCDNGLVSVVRGDPNLSLLSAAFSSLTPAGLDGVISAANTSISIFAPNDKAFVPFLAKQGLALGQLSKLSDKLLAVMLQSVVLKPYTAKQLAGLKTAPSALGQLQKENYPLTFATADGKTTVMAKGDPKPATITNSTLVCGSWLHSVDRFLLPTAKISQAPSVTSAQLAEAVKNGTINPDAAGPSGAAGVEGTPAVSPAAETTGTSSSAPSASSRSSAAAQLTSAIAAVTAVVLMLGSIW